MPEIQEKSKHLEDCLMVNNPKNVKPAPPSTSCFPKRNSIKREDGLDYGLSPKPASKRRSHNWKPLPIRNALDTPVLISKELKQKYMYSPKSVST